MQAHAHFTRLVRTVGIAASLTAALAFGSVAANGNTQGLLECDQGCTVEMFTGANGQIADFQIVSVATGSINAYVSEGPGYIGFTR